MGNQEITFAVALIVQTGGIVGWFFLHLQKRERDMKADQTKEFEKVEKRMERIEQHMKDETEKLTDMVGSLRDVFEVFKIESLKTWAGMTNTMQRIADKLDFGKQQ